ncbi:winged helix-turn-helix domain-containing protein [Thioalkalivibrio sp. ALJ16]|uniref:winged helix-turn-helix domain-containing protein n=1 Tax=Thioalkalivibrio sp. ALJ16 TaxID=1158762 RepID=UPI00036A79C9|nr:winged helix-turn-helix domain-containing protein [Thioalkalivibrio sp. ALJ16]
MAIPDFQTLYRPLLEYAAGADERRLRDAHDALASTFDLTDEEREQLLPSTAKITGSDHGNHLY